MITSRSKRVQKNRTGQRVTTLVKNAMLAQQEIKRYTRAVAGAGTVAGNMYSLSQGLIVGDTISLRDGNSINLKHVQLKLSVIGTSATTVPVVYRVILFHDMFNVGVAPTVAELLDGAAYNSTYLPATSQQHRFKILYDKMHPMCVAASNQAHVIDFNLRSQMKLNYNGSTDVVAANGRASLWMLTIQNSVVGITTAENFYFSMLFTDS
jgi:hypothetical protein